MKKAAIVTITTGENYGNRLQNYAVQTVLDKYGLEVLTIHNNEKKEKKYLKLIKNILKKTILYKKYKRKMARNSNFTKFNKENINFCNLNLNNENVENRNYNNFDYWVAGSDQIWNLNYPENNIVNFLGFVPENIPKISFAASFGTSNIPENSDVRIGMWLKRFDYLSVREDVGKKIIEKLSDRKDVEVLVDPTMLLTSEQWDKVSTKPSMLKSDRYILNYFLGDLSVDRKSEIERIAKENNCDIINMLDEKSPFYECGPSEFLYLEKNAFLICTDSFHSCVFAILYNRPFIIFDRKQEGLVSMNSRIDTLLNKFQLENRIYNDFEITKENLEHNYTTAYKILEEEREKSNEFLKNVLD